MEIKGNVNANGSVASLIELKKFYTSDGETRVFVSGRCLKHSIKRVFLEKKLPLSPLSREQRVLQSKGNPIAYIDDDLFGYMVTEARSAARTRFAPIKTDGIVSLRHCEITKDFGARFDIHGKEDPSPFEIEVTQFIGRNNWIISENIGKYHSKEINDSLIKQHKENLTELEQNGEKWYLLKDELRKERIQNFLKILLKDRYVLPRSTNNLHMPAYYYAVVLPTKRLLPLFDHVEYKIQNGQPMLDIDRLQLFTSLLENNESIHVIDYVENLTSLKENLGTKINISPTKNIDKLINEISNYLVTVK